MDTAPARPAFRFDNSYARDLPGLYVESRPVRVPAPRLLRLNRALAEELGLDPDSLDAAAVFSGNVVPEGAQPIAQAYAGHQFGGFSPQLGDGRALLLGEVIDRHGQRRDIALKGSGRTVFSRGGDGKATVGPVLREYLIGEAMQALGIPTTRALAAVATGAPVLREVELPGAVLTRVAASHIRVGTFQFFAARGESDKLRALADYSIARHYPEVAGPDLAGAANPYLAFFEAVAARQAALVARWMAVGFIHGVMNTDNMAISGETIDYGPCAFMDAYDPGTVFSSIDHTGRYAYGNQPLILGWNLARLAETLLGLIDADEDRAVALATAALERIMPLYRAEWLGQMRAKLGLVGEEDGDLALAEGLLAAMAGPGGEGADWTLTFRRLSRAVAGDARAVRPLFADPAALDAWLPRWRARLAPGAAARMDAVNPVTIPRNHMVEGALGAAVAGDMAPFEALLGVLEAPFADRPGFEAYALPAPASFAGYRTFCGT
ncbi:YdiU family protein [Paracoccaceae bacterium Fryx2]|nr:YdiU family protein [Paracoccaceae bacterium Fryx2]